MSLLLRNTKNSDLVFVFETESAAAKDGFVNLQDIETHRELLQNEDFRHLIIEANKKAVGYLILAGLKDKNENIEFRRIVVAEKGKGYGRKTLQLVKKMAFEELNAHRLWLDVVDFNERARKLYESEGFVQEGVWRECYKGENGGRDSLIFMSILKSEYEGN